MKIKVHKKVTVTKGYLDNLKFDLERKKKELADVKADRDKFRSYFLKLLKTSLQAVGDKNSISATWLTEDLSKLMNKVENWYWY